MEIYKYWSFLCLDVLEHFFPSRSRFGEQDSCFSCCSWSSTEPCSSTPNIPGVPSLLPASLQGWKSLFVFSRDAGTPEEETKEKEEEALLSSWDDLHQQHARKGTNDKNLWIFSCLTGSSDSRGESCSPSLKGIPEEGNRRERGRKTVRRRRHRAVSWISTKSQAGERPHSSVTSQQGGKLGFISLLL